MIELKRNSGDAVNQNIRIYRGSSSESKPTTCSPGSTFYEWDTASGFMFDGEEWLCQTSGGGGKEVYPLIVATDYSGCVLYEGDGMFLDEQPSEDLDPSSLKLIASKGDTLYVVVLVDLPAGGEIPVEFYSTDILESVTLVELTSADFTATSLSGETVHYAQITIPDTDVDGNTWGGGGFIQVLIHSSSDDETVQ